ncbi:MAG: GNAT family N-acetyltransferase [Candidatus Latescibacteria bacterium]|nr:GNAT family N-acetyltransferase [Candidatus Latescibacterota bacterium]
MEIRPITAADIPALFAVRVATRQNTLSLDELNQLGITPESVRQLMRSSHRGWLCQDGDQVVGFAMGNGDTGEMWVIALLPAYEGRGIGARLLQAVEDWLWSLDWQQAWLTTDTDTDLRAYGFYRKQGWQDWKIEHGDRYMTKNNPQRPQN